MLNERARFRLHHPTDFAAPLVTAADAAPDEAVARRAVAAFGLAAQIGDAGAVWAPLLRERQGDLEACLRSGDAGGFARDVAALGRSEAAQGFFGGAGQHRRCAEEPGFAEMLAAWTYDKLLSLAEAIGAVRSELPENGTWGAVTRIPPAELWARVQDRIAIDLTPPASIGGYLGIEAGAVIVQMRTVEAIYAAWRLRELAEESGGGRICEIGAGAGLTAYYAALMGLEDYTIIDLPTMNAVQGYVLAGSRIGDRVALGGEAEAGRSVRILPPEAFAALAGGRIDILYNQDSLPEIAPDAARAYLRDAARLRVPLFLSINQEAHLGAGDGRQISVPELIAQTGGYRRASRHRHWLRQGYLEETYRLR